MKTILIGAGAIGGTVAVLTKETGYDISLLCHGEKAKETLQQQGLLLHGALGEHCAKFNVYSSFKELEDNKFDICIIATKHGAMTECAKNILPYLKDNSLVVGMQNGICTAELADAVGKNRAVGCMIGFGATKSSLTDVMVTSKGRMYIGMTNGYHPENLDYVCNMLSAVLPTEISNDITREQYSKLIINSCINATAAITGQTLGKIIDDKRARNLFLAIAREGMLVARAMKINVPPYATVLNYNALMLMNNKAFDAVCKTVIRIVAKAAFANVRPSTLQSLERGQPTEIDIFNGYFSEMGKKYNVQTPINTKLTAMVHEIEKGQRKITPENLEEFRGMIF